MRMTKEISTMGHHRTGALQGFYKICILSPTGNLAASYMLRGYRVSEDLGRS